MNGPAASPMAPTLAEENRIAPKSTAWPRALLLSWLLAALALSTPALMLQPSRAVGLSITDIFFFWQDVPVLVCATLILFVIARRSADPGAHGLAWPTTQRGAQRLTAAAALGVVMASWIGWRLVCLRYPLAMDEFMATFDAGTLRHGWLAAPVPAMWREYVPALQPDFGLRVPGHAVWSSDYLPINAAIRAMFMLLGDGSLAGALLSGASVVLVFDIARTLWPNRPDAAAAAAVMLASSSQLLLAGMTPYAMPAHLALNLAWLRLYQMNRPGTDLGALAIGWFACGLHQVVFHPLFVAPFILQLFMDRRWTRAITFSLAYVAIGLFWVLYWPGVFHLLGLAAPQGKGGGVASFLSHALKLLNHPDPLQSARLMAENLLRFITWQNPLMVVLLLAGAASTWRAGGVPRALLAGLLLTLALAALLMPSQGLGWGYRYLHGLLGSACLGAAGAYVRLTESDWSPPMARRALSLSVIASLLILAPLRAAQARTFIAPYAHAHQAISTDPADFVVIDARGMLFGTDLVRNQSDFGNRPLVFHLGAMSAPQLEALCRRGRVAIFDRQDGRAFGINTTIAPPPGPANRLDAAMPASGCGARHVAKP